jgi:hypothetical protein
MKLKQRFDGMRYIVDEKDMDFDISLRYYRAIIAWVTMYGDCFILSIKPDDYDNPVYVSRLYALGQILDISNLQDVDYKKAKLIKNIFGRSSETVQVIGIPTSQFLKEMISKPAPPKAISGDIIPVEDILIFKSNRILYISNDYGRSQVLDVSNEELNSLLQSIKQAELDPARIVPAPPYVSSKNT